MSNKLIFADSSEIPCEICGECLGSDAIYIVTELMKVAKAAQLFGKTSKTKCMVYEQGDTQTTFEGYTEIDLIRTDRERTEVFMKKVST